jgi:subfamily B ATP-binding cassette protein MsbA
MIAWAEGRRNLRPLSRLWPLTQGRRWAIALFCLLGTLAALAEGIGTSMLIPLLQGDFLQEGAAVHQGSAALRWLGQVADAMPQDHRGAAIAGIILLSILAKATLAYGYNCLAAWVKIQTARSARTRMFRRLLATSPAYLDSREGEKFLHTLTSSPEQMGQSVLALLWTMLSVITILVFSAMLMAVAWQLTLGVVATLLLLSRLVRTTTRRIDRLGQVHLEASRALSERHSEGVSGVRTIQMYGREEHEYREYVAATGLSSGLTLKRERLLALVHPLSEGLGAVVMIGLVMVAAESGFPLAVLVTVVFMLYRLQPQVQNANANLIRIGAMQAVVDPGLAVLYGGEVPSLPCGERIFSGLRDGIRFRGVSFAYSRNKREALSGVDFEIPRGRTTAIVGPSGAGKSTVIHLLCRLYDPADGRILVDGCDLAQYDLPSWRSRIALVSQDVFLFGGSIRENIAYGKPEATDGEVVAAARRAHADEFVRQLPEGYDTPAGRIGRRLSGGQRQRLSIARALVREPEVLILDEATNSLDTISEAHIQQSIEELCRDRTVVVVAHRLSTLLRADNIVVLDHGAVVEQGRFDELIAREGLFARMYYADRLGVAGR